MSKTVRAATVRARHATTMKKMIDDINAFRSTDPCATTWAVYRDELEVNWTNYNTAYVQHEDTLVGKDDTELGNITTEFATIHTAYIKCKIHLSALIATLATAGNSSILDQSTSHNDGNSVKTVKLPPVKLMKFSGELKDWVEFKATCRSMLPDKIDDAQRLHFLKGSLTDEPRDLIAHILPNPGSYEKAMLLLKNRYENKRAIVNDQLRRLYVLPRNEQEGESASLLRLIVNTLNGLVATLDGCDIETNSWDSILVYNTSQCLHPKSLKSWEENLGAQRTIPTLKMYVDWLETRITILETTQKFRVQDNRRQKPINKQFPQKAYQNKEPAKAFYTLKSDFQCVICKRNHIQTRCDELLRMTLQERKRTVQKHNLCSNCLQMHELEQCPFAATCKKCTGNHHTALHEDSSKIMLTQQNNEPESDDDDDVMSKICSEHFYHVSINSSTLLATAVIPIRWNGRSILVNALIDLGGTTNLISERVCKILNLPIQSGSTSMTGVGGSPVGYVLGRTIGTIGSTHDTKFNLTIGSIVVKTIANTPQIDHDKWNEWTHLHGLQLADPNFLEAHRIDVLLGAAVCSEIMLTGQRKCRGKPMAQETIFGYIVYGPVELNENAQALCYATQHKSTNEASAENLNLLLRAFWEIEEVEFTRHFTHDEQSAEDIFLKSLTCTEDGKFMVDLPFKVDPSTECLGQSREMAEKRLHSSNRRWFSKDAEIKRLYDENLNEYLTLGHMKELEENEVPRNFLPHHPIVKESSTTTKVRTVFDASAKTSNGKSLNDLLYVGPTIQPDLFELLIQWRRYEFAFCGDIEKMYRQIWVNPEHALFQCILWQPPGSNKIKAYKLLTVTFGTASAPFQAIRAIDEIGKRIQDTQPEVSELIRKQFYVDDLFGSASSVAKAKTTRDEVTKTLATHGFHLRKWKANDDEILADLDDSEKDGVIDFSTTFKTLGICWQPSCDKFQFKSSTPKQIETWTKRLVLSEIAKLFDPLGWLAPCVAQAKMVMQEIWKLPTPHNWDKPLPQHIVQKWKLVYEQLCLPISIQIPRWIGINDEDIRIEVHGFCDASTRAYAAAVYLKVCYGDEQNVVNLVAAKTKLAPIKTITIPRLELCGAVLLTKLLSRCVKALALNKFEMHAWTDSMIVLAWLAACPSRWSTFVSYRVAAIQRELPSENWKHVPTESNPADIASRGALIHELADSSMWWHGPEFLKDIKCWPKQFSQSPNDNVPEKRKGVEIFHIDTVEPNYVLENFSNLTRLLRFTAMAMRWHCRKTITGPIKASEITKAKIKWIRIVQHEAFAKDINGIQRKNNAVTPSIQQLNPFIDSDGILRMNGRVGNADMLHQRMARILPASHHFTQLVILDAHESVLHGGVQLTLRKLRDDYWIIHARNQVKKLIHKCITCFRERKPMMGQKMADLPSFRTESAKPFAFVGCDYAGFFQLKTSVRRNAPLTKAYIALFVCLTTKALHLEVVCDLSTAEFIMAFENFISRRGIPQMLYTDNGTNFIGGAKEIKTFFDQMFEQNNALTRLLAINNIEFNRIPARASHMGGIWERAVGSVKYHLRRILKDTKLNARQFDNVLKKIEACLNSRPLWAITGETDDIEVITPSHFFNFQAINTLPRPDLSHIPLNRLDQYQYLYRLYCDFWKSWSNEYLHQLQPRTKWQKEQPNAAVGQIVLISEDNMPPSRWPYGKIVNTYPAKDGLVRTVDVKCGSTVLRRPIHKLALLPTSDNEDLAKNKDIEPVIAQGREDVDAKCQNN